MFFVSKKKYDAMVAERDKWDEIASRAVDICERAHKNEDDAVRLANKLYEDNKRLVAHEEEMLAKIKELEAKLDFAIKQRDYYYDLLESTSEVEDKDE